MSTILASNASIASAYLPPVSEGFGQAPIVLRFPPALVMDEEQFFEFAVQNPDLRIEQNSKGDIELMAPTGMDTGDWNAEINMQLRVWAKKNGTGTTYDSSTLFRLDNKAGRSPDACWIKLERVNQLTKKQRQKFAPLCPDFVLELRSYSDRLIDLQDKLKEFLANGALLGWLIDPYTKTVHIYRPGQEPEILANPATVGGESVLPGFELDLKEIFAE